MVRSVVLMLVALVIAMPAASAQSLTPEQLEAVRRGAASLHVPDSGTVVPLHGPPDLPLVDVHLDGAGPYRFLVDLGSNVVIARRSVMEDAGVPIMLDRDGTDIYVADEMTIGAATFREVWVGAYDDLDVDGVIGYNVLRGTGIMLDYPARRFRLGTLRLPEPNGGTTLQYVVRGRMPYVPARIGDRDLLLNLDTGAANHIVFPTFMADSLPLEAPPVAGPLLWNNQTGSVRNHVGRLAEDLVVGGFVIERPVVLFDPEVEDAWLGSAILVNTRLELDTERRVLRLTSPDPLTAPAFRTLGLRLGPVDDASATRPVVDVIPSTPAADLGIAEDDSIRSIEGVSAAELDARGLRALAADHDEVELVIRRAGRDETLRLDVAELP